MEGRELTMTDVDESPAEASASVLDEPLMTADEVAAALGVHRKFVYARQRSGELRGYKLGPHFRFRRADVRAFLEASVAPVAASSEPYVRQRRSAPAGSFRALLEERAA
jgi:excisionase family DNA binding protein